MALEKPDRVPVVLEYSGFAAYVTRTRMAEFLRSPTKNLDTMIQAYQLVGGGDAINYGSFWPYGLCYDFMSRVAVPGVDLPENEMWQVVESPLMRRDDYDRILDLGWPAFFSDFMKNRVLNRVPESYLPPQRKSPDVQAAWRAEGVPALSGGDVTTPFELLCGSRSLMEFSRDLMEIPDKVVSAMEAITPHLAGDAIADFVIAACQHEGSPPADPGIRVVGPQLIIACEPQLAFAADEGGTAQLAEGTSMNDEDVGKLVARLKDDQVGISPDVGDEYLQVCIRGNVRLEKLGHRSTSLVWHLAARQYSTMERRRRL